MPIYEFYCPDCHAVMSFFSVRVDTETRPDCPRCSRPNLERQASVFSISKNRETPAEDGEDMGDIDDAAMERMFETLAREGGNLDEDDPKSAAKVMRSMFREAGLEMGPSMEEAMRRMEAGEDPEQIEEDLGDALDDDEAQLFSVGKKSLAKHSRPLFRDETIYDL